MTSRSREATHAGSWYTSNGPKLAAELQANLDKVHPLPALDYNPPITDAKAIIAPHAGYSYSGPAAAWAYAAVPTDKIKRVFLLGPSHHSYLNGVALSTFDTYSTPLGEIVLDKQTIAELKATNVFSEMKSSVDEDEHSLEMHLPYLRHIFKGRDDLRLVPILVGHPSASTSTKLSQVLSRYWSDESTFFVISSDFCHWGTRFSHTPYYPNAPSPPSPVPPLHPVDSKHPLPASWKPLELFKRYSSSIANDEVPIWKSIQFMDHEGMDHLKNPAAEGAVEKWEAYLARTGNTICGRNPITVILQLVQDIYPSDQPGPKPEFTFVRYEQSSQCLNARDSSVSYVSGVLRLPH